MDNPQSTFDPYAAPAVSDFSLRNESDGLSLDQRRLLKDFRSQSRALGVLWLFLSAIIGIITFLLSISSSPNNHIIEVAGISSLIAIICATSGIGTLLKRPWGIYTSLTLAYILLILCVLQFSLCTLAFVIAILIQSHRILNFMKELRADGIPLNTKPTVIRSSNSN